MVPHDVSDMYRSFAVLFILIYVPRRPHARAAAAVLGIAGGAGELSHQQTDLSGAATPPGPSVSLARKIVNAQVDGVDFVVLLSMHGAKALSCRCTNESVNADIS